MHGELLMMMILRGVLWELAETDDDVEERGYWQAADVMLAHRLTKVMPTWELLKI